ncbi:MAG: hypothetical protein LBG13_00140 [Holosporales bacterium]|jgi:hypothetical protein|nr:hypothetical protein [Holosporales bacterium]
MSKLILIVALAAACSGNNIYAAGSGFFSSSLGEGIEGETSGDGIERAEVGGVQGAELFLEKAKVGGVQGAELFLKRFNKMVEEISKSSKKAPEKDNIKRVLREARKFSNRTQKKIRKIKRLHNEQEKENELESINFGIRDKINWLGASSAGIGEYQVEVGCHGNVSDGESESSDFESDTDPSRIPTPPEESATDPSRILIPPNESATESVHDNSEYERRIGSTQKEQRKERNRSFRYEEEMEAPQKWQRKKGNKFSQKDERKSKHGNRKNKHKDRSILEEIYLDDYDLDDQDYFD